MAKTDICQCQGSGVLLKGELKFTLLVVKATQLQPTIMTIMIRNKNYF